MVCPISDDKEALNSEEPAQFLGVSAFTIREYAKRETIPANKLGKSWRFYKPDLVAWVRGKAAPAQGQAQDRYSPGLRPPSRCPACCENLSFSGVQTMNEAW
jgi:excisionase family DNA binding protein